MGQHGAAAIFQLLHQSHDEDRIFDERNLAQKPARNPQFFVCFYIMDKDLRPGCFSEQPFIMLNVQDSRIKRKWTRDKVLEWRRNGRD